MGTPFLAEVKIVSFNFAPKGWAMCNGQLLPINQNQALFSLLGTEYGGNGQTTFALPDLRGRVPIHVGNGYTQGAAFGQEAHTLIAAELPTHTHVLRGSSNRGSTTNPVGATFARHRRAPGFHPVADAAGTPTSTVGGSQAHNNMQPYLVLNFVIALLGVFPSRD